MQLPFPQHSLKSVLSQQLIENAQAQTNELINEHEIMRQAYEQANLVIPVSGASVSLCKIPRSP